MICTEIHFLSNTEVKIGTKVPGKARISVMRRRCPNYPDYTEGTLSIKQWG